MMLYRERRDCRSCHSPRLETVLNLGSLCISDFILPGQQEDRAPLELVKCLDCEMVQLRHTVERDHLYRDAYWYRSGVNESMREALKDVVDDACSKIQLKPDDFVVDLGSNDGTMLAFYPRYVWAHGYEPSQLWFEGVRNAHARVWHSYFPLPPEHPVRKGYAGRYKVITSIAQMYNVENIDGYVKAVKELLHPEGVFIVQYQDLESMVEANGVDNLCHEHTLYPSFQALANLVERHGMVITDSSYNKVNGGSQRYTIRHEGDWIIQPEGGLDLSDFGQTAERLKGETMALLQRLKDEGKTVAGIAASTKFNTLAQYYGITPDLMPYIADRSPEKVGRLTVGTHIPIISENELWARKPDYLFCCAWGFFDNFRARYIDLEEAGAQWIVPLPELRIVRGAP